MKKQVVEIEMKDGVCTKADNLYFSANGEIEPSELNANCILVHLFPDYDREGNLVYKKAISINFVDKEMEEPLREEALRIFNQRPSV